MKKVIIILCAVILVLYPVYLSDTMAKPAANSDQVAVCTSSVIVQAQQQPMGKQATEFFGSLTDTQHWPPRWQCGVWTPFHGWLYIVSDIIIWFSYFMIPLTLGYFVYRRKKGTVPFQSVVMLFIAFILACGLTHLVDAAIFWWPAYRVSALIRSITAVVSLGTVFALIRIAPKVIEFKSPETLEKIVELRTGELRELNLQLQQEIAQREKAEQELQQLNRELQEKTRRQEETNLALRAREQDLLASEEKIKAFTQKLEREVEERTRQLTESNQELEAFTYSVSHDLRAPLRAIDGYARILEEDYYEALDPQAKRLLGVITKNARYMGQLIDDLLEFSRTARTEVKHAPFKTSEEVKIIAAELLAQEDETRKVDIEIDALEPCVGDINMLRQVWTNLISNAIKYTRKKPEAKISIGNVVRQHDVEYFVRDNGVGFDMGYANKLFGVFHRLHKKEEFEGTGVGLALVQRILKRHHGDIWADAKIGEGATFYFTLPVA